MIKILSIASYAFSAFLVYVICMTAFINGPIPFNAKFIIMAAFCVPCVASAVFAAWLNRFHAWDRHLGAVLTSGAGMGAALVFTMACMILDADLQEHFPDDKLNRFNDYVTGGVTILLLLGVGIAFLARARNRERREQAEMSSV